MADAASSDPTTEEACAELKERRRRGREAHARLDGILAESAAKLRDMGATLDGFEQFIERLNEKVRARAQRVADRQPPPHLPSGGCSSAS